MPDEYASPHAEASGTMHRDDSDLDFFDAMEVIYFDDILQHERGSSAAESSPTASISDDQDEVVFLRKDDSKRNAQLRRMVHDRRNKLHEMALEQRRILENKILSRRRKLNRIMSEPGFVMNKDKLSFVCGVLIIMIIEAVLLLAPDKMYLLYTALLIPLMTARYVMYRADLQHYFMYDFCYFAQIMMVLHVYKYPSNAQLEKALFSISNGPLLLAIVMWRNSIVFHSFDKMTSMFIHLLPSLVTFCRRWAHHLSDKTFPLNEKIEGSILAIVKDFWCVPFCYYVLWQTIYLVKTEVVSKKKLEYNTEIMTSLRWLTRKKNSSSYKLMSAFGEHNQLPTFVFIQALYTVVTFLVIPLLWHSIWLHAFYVAIIFVVALANGATYYFHVFAKRYIEEIGKRVADVKDGN
ncbi:hypothetical protein ACHAW5_008479 [Stephanodiscus triporus]|uniref:Glycerophosphocholine acyltransferase 1 n=1 Tax=Stephanodiscus triporus TaxID=2934178 RepID=A0ABD3MM72_9STRA